MQENQMYNVKHKVAKGLILWYMRRKGFYGWTSLWNTIYYLDEEYKETESLRLHELKHIEQMDRDGKFLFMVKYMYYDFTLGRQSNPYEVEARQAEHND